MNPPYAVAGRDIEPGMRVILSPEDEAYTVERVEPCVEAPTWLRIVMTNGFRSVVQKDVWYAEVER